MRYRVLITKRAMNQIDAADRWWVDNRPSVPDAIREDVREVIGRLADLPQSGSLVAGTRNPGDRRIVLPRVGYHLYYRVRGDSVEILRFWHASRGAKPRL